MSFLGKMDGNVTLPEEPEHARYALRLFLEKLGCLAADDACGLTGKEPEPRGVIPPKVAIEPLVGQEVRTLVVLYTGPPIPDEAVRRLVADRT